MNTILNAIISIVLALNFASDERVSYAEAEERARAGRKGLWVDAEPVPPWDWRGSQKRKD